MSGLADRVSRLMVPCYPRRWRRRYGDELLALLDEHRSGPRTVVNLALGALGTHFDPAYRREGVTMPGPGSPLRTAAAVAGPFGAVVVVFGGLLALDAWQQQPGPDGERWTWPRICHSQPHTATLSRAQLHTYL
jgi:hypothetical protein